MRRRAAAYLIESGKRSQRRACQLLGIHPSVYRYQRRASEDTALRERLKTLATEYPRYGYPLLHAMVKGEGLVINAKEDVPDLSRGKVAGENQAAQAAAGAGSRGDDDSRSSQSTMVDRLHVGPVVDR